MKITAIQLCIDEWGTVTRFANAIGRDASAVCRWNRPRSEGGCGGFMPMEATVATLKALRRRKKSTITADELLLGREAAKK